MVKENGIYINEQNIFSLKKTLPFLTIQKELGEHDAM